MMPQRFTDRQIKWLILLIPTLTVGVWEYVRHAFLLPYLTMHMGNWLTPFIVLIVTLTLVRHLFARLEQSQAALQGERAVSASLEEREQLARELHDGIAQSLFLLAVKLDRLDRAATEGEERVLALSDELKETVRVIHEDVRQAIANLRNPPSPADAAWVTPLRELISDTASVTEAEAEFRWAIPDTALTGKEKVELHACLREALMNVRKHAGASHVRVIGEVTGTAGEATGAVGGAAEAAGESIGVVGEVTGTAGEGFKCTVEDDGAGFAADPMTMHGRFGLRMVRDRAERMGWTFAAQRRGDWTVVEIAKPAGESTK